MFTYRLLLCIMLIAPIMLLGCGSKKEPKIIPVDEHIPVITKNEKDIEFKIRKRKINFHNKVDNTSGIISNCKVGDVLGIGDSCKDGTGDIFTVLEDSHGKYSDGKYLNITTNTGISIFGEISGKKRSFEAEQRKDGKWVIESVTPK